MRHAIAAAFLEAGADINARSIEFNETPRVTAVPGSAAKSRSWPSAGEGWFGPCPLRHKPFAQRGLTLADVREGRLNVEVEFRGQHFTSAIDFRDNRIFPHSVNLP